MWKRSVGTVAGFLAAACGARTGLESGAGGTVAIASGRGGSGADGSGTGGGGAASGSGGDGGGAGAPRVAAVVVGDSRSCALTTSGAVRCWGENGNGAAGYGKGLCAEPPIPCTDACCIGDDETPASTGQLVDVGGTVTQLSAGSMHTCALLDTGRVRCWGHGADGRLGYGNTLDIGDDETPAAAGDVDVGGDVVEVAVGSGISAGGHTCARLRRGSVRCWGDGSVGALGYGNTETIGDDESPAAAGDVNIGGAAIQIVAGDGFSCALLQGGNVRCWGYGRRGRLGYGNTETIGDDESPAAAGDVDVGATVVRLSAGNSRHVCALLDTGRIRCWGFGAHGQLGYGNTEDVGDDETPAAVGDVPLPALAIDLAVGRDGTCAVLAGGALICWGNNANGELGQPALRAGCFSCEPNCCLGDDETLVSAPVIDVGGPVLQVARGGYNVCALLSAGNVRCWGSGWYGALGYGNTATIGDDETPSAAGDVPVF